MSTEQASFVAIYFTNWWRSDTGEHVATIVDCQPEDEKVLNVSREFFMNEMRKEMTGVLLINRETLSYSIAKLKA
jgi:hypothetical protein